MNMIAIRRAENEFEDEPPEAAPDQGSKLRALYSFLRRRWVFIVPTALVVFAAVYATALMSPKIYTANALVMVNPGRQQVLQQNQMIDDAAPSSTLVDSEIEVLRSPLLARRVVVALRLDRDPDYNGAVRAPQGISAIIAAARAAISPQLPGPAAAPSRALVDNLAANLSTSINVHRRGVSYAIDVSASAKSPRRAAEIANKLVELYLASQVDARFEASQRANEWLSKRLDELRQEVAAKERIAEDFRQAHGLSVAAGGGDQPQSADMQNTMVQTRVDLAEKEARLRQVQQLGAGGASDSIVGMVDSGLIAQLKGQESDLKRKQSELEQRYGDLHPAVRKNADDLKAVQQRIREEVTRLTNSMRSEVEISRARLGTLQGSFGIVSGTLGEKNNDDVIRYREMMRDADAVRAVQASFLERFHQVADQGDLPVATSRVVSNATEPSGPSAPNMRSALQMALLLGIGAGLALAFLVELLDASLSGAEDVERKLSLRAIASVPMLRKTDMVGLSEDHRHPAGYLVEKPMSGFAEAFRVLQTSIVHARIDHKVGVVAVTSAVPSEGKTTISLCLARIAAMSGQRVVLVDCDLRRHSLNEYLNLDPKNGILEVLMGGVAWRDALVQDRDTSVQILPVAPTKFTPIDVFSSNAMAKLVDDLRNAFDLVILDCAPILAVAETRVLVKHADIVTLAVRSGRTPAAAARNAIKNIKAAGGEVRGVTLNCVDPRSPGRHDYGDSLYYNYAQKHYYTN